MLLWNNIIVSFLHDVKAYCAHQKNWLFVSWIQKDCNFEKSSMSLMHTTGILLWFWFCLSGDPYKVCLILTLQWPQLCRLECFRLIFLLSSIFHLNATCHSETLTAPICTHYFHLSLFSKLTVELKNIPETLLRSGENRLTFQWQWWPLKFVRFTANLKIVLLDQNKTSILKYS